MSELDEAKFWVALTKLQVDLGEIQRRTSENHKAIRALAMVVFPVE